MRRAEPVLKIGILASHPIQYLVPVFRTVSAMTGVRLQVLFRTRAGLDAYVDEGFGKTVQWDSPMLGGYACEFLSQSSAVGGFQWRIIPALLRHRFDVLVVHGYNSGTNLLAILLCRLLGIRLLLRGDTRLESRHHPSRLKTALFSLFDGFLSIGRLNADFYRHYGARVEQIYFAPLSIDDGAFRLSEGERLRHRAAVRRQLGIEPDAKVVLFVSKLIRRKRADDLVRAFSLVATQFPGAVLCVCGSGNELATLQEVARPLGSRVFFLGFRNQLELPGVYAAADIFVHPAAAEPWGLVVNEAITAGLPVISSDDVGAAADLVEGQGTGMVYPCGDIPALASVLAIMLGDDALRASMGNAASELSRQWGVAECARLLAAAARSVCSKGRGA